jgi:hypothetical protein
VNEPRRQGGRSWRLDGTASFWGTNQDDKAARQSWGMDPGPGGPRRMDGSLDWLTLGLSWDLLVIFVIFSTPIKHP